MEMRLVPNCGKRGERKNTSKIDPTETCVLDDAYCVCLIMVCLGSRASHKDVADIGIQS